MKLASPYFTGDTHNARSLALQVLLACRNTTPSFRKSSIASSRRIALSAADRRLTTQLVYGVLRRRGTLRAMLEPFVNRPAHKVEPWLWDALYLGAYQLALLSHIPTHAAVHETVELAVSFGRPGARGFLNGILRRVSELMTDERTDRAGGRRAAAGARRISSPVSSRLPRSGGTAASNISLPRSACPIGWFTAGCRVTASRNASVSASGSPVLLH